MIRVLRVLRPGSSGIKKIEQRFGNKLVCVRYRYDEERQMTIKTVELVVDEFPRHFKTKKPNPDEKQYIRIGYHEKDLREKIKKAGGWWKAEEKLWELPYKDVIRLDLEDRMIQK
ncbi:MAG: hypothetical protein GF313_08365 [Caldithrix sp.]|nr:hypothetical protein [Caldithrix sp.]